MQNVTCFFCGTRIAEVLRRPSVCLSQGDLSQLGRVVMQGGFSVWISHKRAAVRMKELARFKPMQRHLFLYDHALLFCKRRDEDTADRTPFYSFKSCLRVTLDDTPAVCGSVRCESGQ